VMITVRQYIPTDAENHYDAVKASIERLAKWFSWAKPNYCLCDSIEFIESQSEQEDKRHYAIVGGTCSSKFLGSCSWSRVETYDNKWTVSLSYWRRQDSKEKNVMGRAVRQVVDLAFKEGIQRVEIDIADCNLRSIKVACDVNAVPERSVTVNGGDGKKHRGKRYVIERKQTNK